MRLGYGRIQPPSPALVVGARSQERRQQQISGHAVGDVACGDPDDEPAARGMTAEDDGGRPLAGADEGDEIADVVPHLIRVNGDGAGAGQAMAAHIGCVNLGVGVPGDGAGEDVQVAAMAGRAMDQDHRAIGIRRPMPVCEAPAIPGRERRRRRHGAPVGGEKAREACLPDAARDSLGLVAADVPQQLEQVVRHACRRRPPQQSTAAIIRTPRTAVP